MIHVIAMMTHNDQTVDGAYSHYMTNRNAKTKDWGFKDTNIVREDARKLSAAMLNDGKEVFFESLATTEEEALEAARLAVASNARYVVGMEYFTSVHKYFNEHNVKYYPTCGKRAGYPKRMLYGTIDEIIADAKRILETGVAGICLSVFRYVDGDPLELAKTFVKEVDAPLVLTGSIDSDERLDFVKEVKPWGFTVGSALFEEGYFPGKTIADKLDHISDYIAG